MVYFQKVFVFGLVTIFLFIADVRVYSFTLILSVDYLLKIADFFTGAMQSGEEASKVQNTRSTSSIKETPSSRSSAKTAVVTEKETTMTVNLRIEKPDIVLVEHMDNIDTNALILNVNSLSNSYYYFHHDNFFRLKF